MRQKSPAASPLGRGQRPAAAAAIVFFAAAFALAQAAGPRQKITFMPSGATALAECAETTAERARGLMFRTSMGEREAMLFSFEAPALQTFWMYHTRIPLTVIFIDDNFRIVDMQDMTPCPSEDPGACPIYTSRLKARHAIEVNQGFAAKYGIKVGDRIVVGKTGR
jgi:hypothetical protein